MENGKLQKTEVEQFKAALYEELVLKYRDARCFKINGPVFETDGGGWCTVTEKFELQEDCGNFAVFVKEDNLSSSPYDEYGFFPTKKAAISAAIGNGVVFKEEFATFEKYKTPEEIDGTGRFVVEIDLSWHNAKDNDVLYCH